MKEIIRSQILDSNESVFFARQLEHIKAAAYDVVYPEFKALSLIPISTEAGPGASSITYRQFDRVGLAKIVAFYGDDLPRSDIKGSEFTAKVRSIGGSFGYNVQEVRQAVMSNRDLPTMKANAARKANDQLVNQIAWFGDSAHGLQGLIYNANVTKGSLTTGNWASATAEQIIGDVNTQISNVLSLTKGVEVPDTYLMPVAQYARIASLLRSSSASDTTVLAFLQKVWPDITFMAVPELAALATVPSTGASTPTNVTICYKRSPEKLTLEIPQPYEQFPAQERNLEFVIPCHSRCGGVIVYYPLSISIGEGC